MTTVKLPALALLAAIISLIFLPSCALQTRHPLSTTPQPNTITPDTSITTPPPIPVSPPQPTLFATPTTTETITVSATPPTPAPPPALPFLKTYYTRAREALSDGVYREAAVQLRNAAELMDQVIVTAPYYTESQPWLVAARDTLHELADRANRGELASPADLERGFGRAFRAVARFQADLARPPARPADAPPPPWEDP